MDFYKNKKALQIIRYLVIIGSFILLLMNCYTSILNEKINYFGIISNICMIVAMIVFIKIEKKIVLKHKKKVNPSDE
ncbi:hypothetical protein [Flavobacterium sp.]|uniref:hypothetical protein n=1 Tax=Flavobacterium sp. TaxID=239 RepID=UPI002B4B1093|nr:hypothetical protein [Flavobacterium sp.]HLF52668.1 hypothetical protein [Flavobacterium sp.]